MIGRGQIVTIAIRRFLTTMAAPSAAPTGPAILNGPHREIYFPKILAAIPNAVTDTKVDNTELINNGKVAR